MQTFSRCLTLASVLTLAGCAGTANNNSYEVAEVGSFHVGGQQVTLSGLPAREIIFTAGAAPRKVDPNGDFEAGQMYAQYVKLKNPKARYPLMLWHGGGLAGTTWETKPDGGPGWQQFFLTQGHTVYVPDAMERGRASWSRYPEIYKTEPFFRTKQEGWELFRIGADGSYNTDPAKRVAYAGTQFPVAAFDQFGKQSIPRWATNDVATQAAYDALVQKACPCVIVVHSQGGNFAFNAALRAPDMIKAIVAVEPSGAPDPDQVDIKALKAIPFLFVWGDFVEQNASWRQYVKAPNKFQQALQAQGGVADRLDLPAQGIRGNSHMLMMDRNSDQVAALVQVWMNKNGLMK